MSAFTRATTGSTPGTLNGQARSAGVVTRGRRRPAVMVGGVVLVIFGALVAAWFVAAAGDRASVLRLARDVPYGAMLTAQDVTPVEVAVDPAVGTVPAQEADRVVGMVAGTDLVAGSLLAPGQVTPVGPPGPGEVLVPLALDAARMPAGGLRPGDRLLVVDTPPADADPPESSPRTFDVGVVRVGTADLNGLVVVDVVVAEGEGPAVAARAATGRFALLLQPADSSTAGERS
ncbi:SAF domain-containing protein [Cellulomonas fimi]|uniref:SAF domain-containing protein n=1 Tax=Cellulomonas fimi TaxID=1708 RepID=A0A7Y0LXL2_CELFI|nr:SAF domain-containing protein [Cellulomonas fimi]NMR19228.1 hypothetical protein [Cellulomonas fimi]